MPREIKFRAWDKERKQMENTIDVNPFYISDCDRRRWKWGEVELMQFTGLHDKNGKEIYEGDIVKCTEATESRVSEYVSEVFWDDCCFLVHESKSSDCELGLFVESKFKCPLTEIEVIGNIHDNPEVSPC